MNARAMLLGGLLGGLSALSGCASHTPLPKQQAALVVGLPLTLQIQRQQPPTSPENWLLVVQRENAGLRWSLFAPLGIPLARQQLLDGAWQNDGLLPPNGEARELFAALLFALTPSAALANNYDADSWQEHADGQRRLNPDWRIRYRAPVDFTLFGADGLSYLVHALPPKEPR